MPRQALAVAVGHRVPRLDGERERHECRLRGIERVEQLLHPRERGDPRPQLERMHRLREEVVGARFNPFDAVLQIAETGDEDDGRQPRRRIRFDTAAHLEAVDLRHCHVEQDDVGVMFLHGRERGLAVTDVNDLVAVGGQKLPIQRTNAVRVVGDENTTATR